MELETVHDQLRATGIELRSYAEGDRKTTCPKCSHERKNKRDLCLSVTIEPGKAVWNCHHCGWSGSVHERRDDFEPRCPASRPVKPEYKAPETGLPENVVDWFRKRGITEATLARNGIGYGPAYIPAAQAEVNCIHFPYHRNSEVVNVKYRDTQKRFAQVKGAEKVLFGLDDIQGRSTVIVVEGEIDKLSFEEAGMTNVVSVPDGAPAKIGAWPRDPNDDKKFDFLRNCETELEHVERFILAVDGDGPGRALEEELSRRLGRERCWRVAWPNINDAAVKDANECLTVHGAQALREVIETAQPYPIASLFDASAFESETISLFRDGPQRTFSTGFPSVDEFMQIREGELSVVTGVPGAGKSEFVDAIQVNLARQFGWRFGVCSFENPPTEHIAKLAEKYLGQPFWDGPTPQMGEADLRSAITWLKEHFYFIRADDEAPTIDWILETARAAVLRHGIRGLLIDPYNEIEHKRPAAMSETEYVSQVLGKVKRFAQAHGVHVWFVAHPSKIRPDDSGKIRAPTLYEISGSAHWVNKADIGVVVHRDPNEHPPRTEVYVRKVRFKSVGKPGKATLGYDRATGRYFDRSAA